MTADKAFQRGSLVRGVWRDRHYLRQTELDGSMLEPEGHANARSASLVRALLRRYRPLGVRYLPAR
jgi:hypothetical protein